MRGLRHCTTVAVALVAIGCATTPPQTIEPQVTANFDFEPPSRTALDSASVAFCLVKPQYAESWKELVQYYPFDKFTGNMATDFEEIISARGFRMRGPFASYDEMAFPDKSQTDLVLMPKIEVDFKELGQSQMGTDLLGTPWFRWKGNVTLQGRIVVAINETLSNERMWSKSIDLPMRSFAYETPKYAGQVPGPMADDVKFTNLLAKHLQEYYTLTMSDVWKYLDPQEMAMVRDQAKILKDKVRYGG